MSGKTRSTNPPKIRRLSHNEIDRRIEGAAAEVAARVEASGDQAIDVYGAGPHWIAPGDFVRHMRPFVVLN